MTKGRSKKSLEVQSQKLITIGLAEGLYTLDNRSSSRSYVGSQEKFIAEAGFLDTCSCLYDKVCWSVGRSVGPHITHICRKV